MDVMRNSDFELGNEKYWSAPGFASFEVNTDDPKIGTYAAKLVTGAGTDQMLNNLDMIPVNAGELVRVGAYVKGVVASYCALGFTAYTKDGLEVGFVGGSRFAPKSYSTYFEDVLEVPTWASYITFGLLAANPGAGVTMYVDLCSLQINTEIMSKYREMQLIHDTGLSAAGDTKSFSKYMIEMIDFYAYLDFDAQAGHTADCTIKVVEKAEEGGWMTVGTFAVTAIDAVEKIVLSNAIGRMLAVEYTFGAGTINCDIYVNVVGKR